MDESDAVRMCWRGALLPLRRAEAQRQTSPDLTIAKPRPPMRMTVPDNSEKAGKPQTSTHWPALVSWAIEDGISEMKATAEDFVRIADLRRQDRKDFAGNHRTLRPLRTRTLSSSTQVTIEIFSLSLSRARFEKLKMDYYRIPVGPAEKCLLDKRKRNVVLLSGSTGVPTEQKSIQEFFS